MYNTRSYNGVARGRTTCGSASEADYCSTGQEENDKRRRGEKEKKEKPQPFFHWPGDEAKRSRCRKSPSSQTPSEELRQTCRKCRYKCMVLIGIFWVLFTQLIYRIVYDFLGKREHTEFVATQLIHWLNRQANETLNSHIDSDKKKD